MRVEILNAAENDLEEGFRFYEAQSVGLGAYFLDSLFSDIDSPAYQPQPLGTLDEIRADIFAVEKESDGLLEVLLKGGKP
ncbi:MAG TPA: type II toxin-antitoxin system RelE/ParE family toxin [Candidatus Ozemobacteraceae bacterium]|nr:type II toxin-antitoxin system RelE/ParE family toxin [Candidatus Ozemobacteraceae bacterium]